MANILCKWWILRCNRVSLISLISVALVISFFHNHALVTQAMPEIASVDVFGCHCYFFCHWTLTKMNTPIWWVDLISTPRPPWRLPSWYDMIREDLRS